MKKILLVVTLLTLTFSTLLTFPAPVSADLPEGSGCAVGGEKCASGLTCKPGVTETGGTGNFCQPITSKEVNGVLGKVVPPDEITKIGFGAAGLSNFLSTAIQLIYIVAGVVFVFMVIISALQWIMSGGDKEAVSKARDRLTHAIIGIVLLALAFFIIKIIGQITGFEFFVGQNDPPPPIPPIK